MRRPGRDTQQLQGAGCGSRFGRSGSRVINEFPARGGEPAAAARLADRGCRGETQRRPPRRAIASRPAEVEQYVALRVPRLVVLLDLRRPARDGAPRLAAARVSPRTAIDESSGCGRFAASCGELSSPGTWIVQAAILILLLALPRVAAWSAHGTLAALVVGAPSAVVLSAGGGARQPETSAAVLMVVVVAAYVLGVVYAVAAPRLGRRPAAYHDDDEPPPRRPRPVERGAGVPARPAGHGRRRVPREGRAGRPTSRRLDPGSERDVPPPRRRRARPPGRRPGPHPDHRRTRRRRHDLPPPRPARVAADVGRRARLGRVRRRGGAAPGRIVAARRGPTRRDARPSADLPARQPDRRRDRPPAAERARRSARSRAASGRRSTGSRRRPRRMPGCSRTSRPGR